MKNWEPLLTEVIKVVPSLLWVLLVATLIWTFRRQLKTLMGQVELRLLRGEPVKLWLLELERISQDAIEAMAQSANVAISRDKGRQNEIRSIYERSNYVMLVDVSRPIPPERGRALWEVFLFVTAHYHGDRLDEVARVEYALDTGWGDRVFTCSDARRSFALRFATFGPVLCTARVVFKDESKAAALLQRYVHLD